MNIWLINHYAVPPQYYPLARQTCFARYLMAMGHTVTIFAASTVHNSNMNLITDGAPWRDEVVDGVHYVYIRCMDYQGNGLKRIYNICEFAWKLTRCHCGHLYAPHVLCHGDSSGPEIRLPGRGGDRRSLAGVHCGLWDRRTPESRGAGPSAAGEVDL